MMMVVLILLILMTGCKVGAVESESTHFPLMWPVFISRRRRHTGVKFVIGSLPCSERFFFRVLRCFPLLKNQHVQILIRSGTHGHI